MADFKPNSCRTCFYNEMNGMACEHDALPINDCWKAAEWFEAYQQLEQQLADISSRRDELEKWYSDHVASTAQLRDDLAAAQKDIETVEKQKQRLLEERTDVEKQLADVLAHKPVSQLMKWPVSQLMKKNIVLENKLAARTHEVRDGDGTIAVLEEQLAVARNAAKVMNDENQGLVDNINKHLYHLGTCSPRLLVQEAAEQLDAAKARIVELGKQFSVVNAALKGRDAQIAKALVIIAGSTWLGAIQLDLLRGTLIG